MWTRVSKVYLTLAKSAHTASCIQRVSDACMAARLEATSRLIRQNITTQEESMEKVFKVEFMNENDDILEEGEITADSFKQCMQAIVQMWDKMVPTHAVSVSVHYEETQDHNDDPDDVGEDEKLPSGNEVAGDGMPEDISHHDLDDTDADREACSDNSETIGMYTDWIRDA